MKKTFTLILIILILFISSCTTGINNGDSGSERENFRTGTDGITMNFVSGNPPGSIASTEGLSVIIEYSNKGATPANDLVFYLSGYDPSIIAFGSPVLAYSSPPMAGKDQFNQLGSQKEFINWKAQINVPPGTDSFVQDLTLTACYAYQTIANPSICIDPKQYDVVVSEKCSFSVKDLGSSQGGPIAVTNVVQNTRDNKIHLQITIENKGSGNPFAPNLPTQGCYNSLKLNDIDTLVVSEVTLPGGRRFTCQPQGIIRLNNKRAVVYCELPISGQSYFVSPLKIVLDYKYRQTLPTHTLKISNYG